jgi:hypothetical protein
LANERITMIFPVLGLTAFAAMYWSGARERYWILTDGQQTMAQVTDVGGHNSIYYTYSAGGTNFTSHGPREYRDPRYSNVGTGGTSTVWYSASHPWISTPRHPDAVVEALPWIVLVTLFDILCLAALIHSWSKPSSGEPLSSQK